VGGMADLMSGMGRPCRGFNVFDNGVLVCPRDIHAFARAIDLLVRDSELRVRMGQAGKVFAFQNFSKERLAQDMEALYRKLTVSHAGALPERVSSN